MKRFVCVVWPENMAVQRRTVARPVNLAQASPSRLGEMKQGARLSFLREKSPRRLAQFLSEQATRPSPSFWRSRLGEGEARLSEMLGETVL